MRNTKFLQREGKYTRAYAKTLLTLYYGLPYATWITNDRDDYLSKTMRILLGKAPIMEGKDSYAQIKRHNTSYNLPSRRADLKMLAPLLRPCLNQERNVGTSPTC